MQDLAMGRTNITGSAGSSEVQTIMLKQMPLITQDAEVSRVVTAEQIQAIENALFTAGMPVAALMEKVAGRVAQWIMTHYPRDHAPLVGFIIGPGHNGGDALVVARELHHRGYQVLLWCPFPRLKELTAQHQAYLEYLGVRCTQQGADLRFCNLLVDGGFGVGLSRPLSDNFAEVIDRINTWGLPVVSIDLPSGLETDSGNVLGTVLRADHTLCLGLWKLGLLQDQALPWIGKTHLIPFDVPSVALKSVLKDTPEHYVITPEIALKALPVHRSPIAHKYTAGHCLLIAGSRQYAGAVLLAGMGAVASGVGMLTLVVPESLKLTVVSQLPEALVLGAPETKTGAIAHLPPDLEWAKYDVVACGPGLSLDLGEWMTQVIACPCPLILDADALNWLAQQAPVDLLKARSAPTLLTPHLGEFRRLFPDWLQQADAPSAAASRAAIATRSTVLLKGAISAIAHPNGQLWFNPNSTAALARGGSGDVLTGLVAGIATQRFRQGDTHFLSAILGAVWWHAQTAIQIAADRTVLGCSPTQLAQRLTATLAIAIGEYTSPTTDPLPW